MRNEPRIIRFGILCNGLVFSSWQALAIEKLLTQKDIRLEILITIPPGNSSKEIGRKQLIWQWYKRFYIKKASKADRHGDVRALLKDVPILECDVNETGNIEHPEAKDIEKIKSCHLDFIVHFGYGKIRGAILKAAKYGIWSYGHEELENHSGGLSGFWEIVNEEKITGTFLQRLAEKREDATILKKGFFKTHHSLIKNRDQLLFESSDWLRSACVDIRYDQTENWQEKPSHIKGPAGKMPSNRQMILYFTRSFRWLLKKAYKSIFITDYWNIGVAMAPIHTFLEAENTPEIVWFPKLPKNQFFADPFGLYLDGKLQMMFEVFPFKKGIGELASLQFDGSHFDKPETTIREPFHMSYPFVLKYKEEIYCIPETYQANEVRLYKALQFPNVWEFDRVLIADYAGIDNTPYFHNGLWWLFSTDKKDGPHFKLNIFYASDFQGKWIAHPKNPVKTDIRSARPAGTLFEHQGDIFRPAMDYSEKVEGRLIINKILKLSETDFEEVAVQTINPIRNTYFSDKIHTLCEAGPYTLIDGARELFVLSNPYALWYKIVSKFRKLRSK